MAKIIKKNPPPSPPNPEKKHHRTAIAFLFAVPAVGCLVLFAFSASYIALAISCICFFICICIAIFVNTDFSPPTNQSKRYGDKGEQRAGDIFEHYLPDEYTVFQNCKVSFNGKSSEIDNIIVGKSGIFIVEVKNMKGSIRGDYAQSQWLQDKVDQYDIAHQKSFYNPVKQTGTHIYRLANFLRDNNIFTHISGAVFFVNPETTVNIIGEPADIPIFTCRSTPELLTYIQSGTANLSAKKLAAVIALLQE